MRSCQKAACSNSECTPLPTPIRPLLCSVCHLRDHQTVQRSTVSSVASHYCSAHDRSTQRPAFCLRLIASHRLRARNVVAPHDTYARVLRSIVRTAERFLSIWSASSRSSRKGPTTTTIATVSCHQRPSRGLPDVVGNVEKAPRRPSDSKWSRVRTGADLDGT